MEVISRKHVLVEIDKGITFFPGSVTWVAYSLGTYMITYSNYKDYRSFEYGLGAWGVYDYGYTGAAELVEACHGREPVLRVGTVLVDLINYAKVDSIKECAGLEKTFYFDPSTQILYTHFDDNNPPWTYESITVGATKGFAKYEGYYDNIFYEAKITSIPSVKLAKDSQYFGVLSYDKATIQLFNKNGAFDHFNEGNYYGQQLKILTSDYPEYNTFDAVYSGFIESFSIDADFMSITARDIRKTLDQKIPYLVFSKTDYPNLSDDYVGKPFPLCYGSCKKVPCTPLDGRDGQANYTFKIADTSRYSLTSCSAVYVENNPVAFSSFSAANGTFSLSSSVYKTGSVVTADVVGYNITNPLEILEDIFLEYFDKPLDDVYYDLTQWEEVRDSGLPPINLFVSDFTSTSDIINLAAASLQGLFMIDSYGRFTFKLQNRSAASIKTIYASELIEKPAVDYISDELLSSVRIGYNKKWSQELGYTWYLNRDDEIEISANYRKKVIKDYETLLSTEEDAIALSEQVMESFGGIFGTYTFKTKIHHYDLNILDNIDIELYIFPNGTYGKIKLEIISIDYDYFNNEITFQGRWIEDVTANISQAKLIRSYRKM